MMGHKKGLHALTFALLAIGGLNWLVWALFKTDVGAWIGGMGTVQAKVVYILVGLSALYEIFTHGHRCKECKGEMGMGNGMGMNKPM